MFTCVFGRYVASTVLLVPKLQAALVYDILPFGGRCREATPTLRKEGCRKPVLGVWLVPRPFGERWQRHWKLLGNTTECPSSGVTNSGRVSVEGAFPESDARGVRLTLITFPQQPGLERIIALWPDEEHRHRHIHTDSRFKIALSVISSEKLKCGWTLTTSCHSTH